MNLSGISTYLPPWGTAATRVPGNDEDTTTLAVAAAAPLLGRQQAPSCVVLVTRDPVTLSPGSAAAVLAALRLPSSVPVTEVLGGPAAVVEALANASAGTLVIGVDVTTSAGSAAALVGDSGPSITVDERSARSLPVTVRAADGRVYAYDDPRLERERGWGRGLSGVAVDAVAGVSARQARGVVSSSIPPVSLVGAASALHALAGLVATGRGGRVLAVDAGSTVTATVGAGEATILRDEPPVLAATPGRASEGPAIKISMPAYDRAFDAKLGLRASECPKCGTLAYPPRALCLNCRYDGEMGSRPLPDDATVYTATTVHVPVPGIATPYTLAVCELGDTGVRLLAPVTGAPAGSVSIGDAGRLVLRRHAVRSGVADYGYSFRPGAVDQSAGEAR